MIEPLGHRVLVKQDKIEDTDPAFHKAKAIGLVFAESKEAMREQAAVDTGVVIAVGPSAWKDFGTEPWAKVGDRIAFAKHAGKSIKEGDVFYLILNDEDVVARVGVKND